MKLVTAGLDYEIVVSAENNAYLLWQCLLFHAACVRVQAATPCFVVHASGPLLAGFHELSRLGARVSAAPNYRAGARIDYPPRNTPGSLLEADHDREWTFLCDPDLLILRKLPSQAASLCGGRSISWESSSFMQTGPIEAWLTGACRERGIDPVHVARHGAGGSVPHFVHRDVQRRFAKAWLAATDTLIDYGVRTSDMHWVASMWGFALATWELDIDVALTSITQTSYLGSATPESSLHAPLLHYSYGDELFHKHNHCTTATAPGVWKVKAEGSSVSAMLLRRMAEARSWFLEKGIDVTEPSLYEPVPEGHGESSAPSNHLASSTTVRAASVVGSPSTR